VAESEGPRPRLELLATVILALAAVATAWVAFQSAKWSGVQANSYAASSAARIQGSTASELAQAERVVDVVAFTSWLSALDADRRKDPSILTPDGMFVAKPGYLSSFLYQRFRAEFRPALDDWLRSKPLTNPAAAPTPFATAAYKLAADQQAQDLQQQAETFSGQARKAIQTANNYVLTGVLFASTLFFIGVSSRTAGRFRSALLIMAGVTFVAALSVVVSYPVRL
jgi:hypothetical protein